MTAARAWCGLRSSICSIGLDSCSIEVDTGKLDNGVAAAVAVIGRCGTGAIAPKPKAKIAPPPTVRRNVTPTVRFTVQPPSLSWIKRAVYGWPYGTLSAKKESNRDVTDRVRPYTNRAQLVNP